MTDLHNHLFEQLERLNDDDLTDDQLQKEIQRTKAMTMIASNMINNTNIALETAKFATEYCQNQNDIPEILRINSK